MDKNTEEIIVNTFFIPQKRERALYELFSIKKRGAFIWKLSQNIIIKQKAERIMASVASYETVKELLLAMNAPLECYVLSIDNEIDGRFLPLDDALHKAVGSGPALLSCIHGSLGYLECEQSRGAPDRFILTSKKIMLDKRK